MNASSTKASQCLLFFTQMIPFWQVQTLKSWMPLSKKCKLWASISQWKETSQTFLGVQIDRINDKTFNLSQPHLINDIIKELRLDGDKDVAIKKTTGASSKTLCRHLDAPPFDDHFNYRRVIGQMNYHEKCSRLDICCAAASRSKVCFQCKVSTWQSIEVAGQVPGGFKRTKE